MCTQNCAKRDITFFIIDGHHVTGEFEIADHYNTLYSDVAVDLWNKIAPASLEFTWHSMHVSIPNSFIGTQSIAMSAFTPGKIKTIGSY